jgi:hypothetical protein
LKDLLRASVITDTPAESENVFDMLTSLPFAKVVEVKNGFQDKNGKPFDPADYADIKIILLVGSDPRYQFEELVEIQIIQRVNLDQKKIMHKI